MLTCFSPATTTICGISAAYFSLAKIGSMRLACAPTLSIRQTFLPVGSPSML